MVSEFHGRAGGLMMMRALGECSPEAGDVVMDFSDLQEGSRACPRDKGALIARFGRAAGLKPEFDVAAPAAACGLSQTMVGAIYGWVFTGELISALTRLGRMPVIYESIGAYGGSGRIRKFQNGDIAFHEDHDVPPIARGVLASRYIDTVSAMLRRVEEEHRSDLDRAGAWAREANSLYMYSMGHIFPSEVADTAIGRVFRSGELHAGFRLKEPEDILAAGDLVVHIGYQHPPEGLLGRARSAKARVAYVCLRQARDFARDESVIRIDPMWDWSDACLPIQGYDVPVLPASGVVNSAIAWEIYRLTREAS